MTYAVKIGDFITNMIIANESQVQELEQALKAEFLDPTVLGLTIGDYWDGKNWTRNVNGEQFILEPIEQEPSELEKLRADVDYLLMMEEG